MLLQNKRRLADILNMDLFASSKINWLIYPQYSNSTTPYKSLDGATYAPWDFAQELTTFYNRIDVNAAINVEYPMPQRTVPFYCATEASYSALYNEIFNQTLNLYFVEDPHILYSTHLERIIERSRSDFWFSRTAIRSGYNSISTPRHVDPLEIMPIEIKRVAVFEIADPSRDLLHYLQTSSDYASPGYQLISYMNSIGAKYGVLTTGFQTWVIRRREDNSFDVSPRQSQGSWLRVLFYACWMAREHYVAHQNDPPKPKSVVKKTAKKDKSKDKKVSNSSSSPASSSSSLSSLSSGSNSSNQQPFLDFDLMITDEKLGEGRSGFVYRGYLDKNENRISVAVKVCNKTVGIQQEMENEARILKYANERNIKAAPHIFYSGPYNELYINVVELFDSSCYYQKSFRLLDKEEFKLFDKAVKELQSHNIKHGDIRKENVFFSVCRQHVKIIDYGYSKIVCPSLNDSGDSGKNENRKSVADLNLRNKNIF